SDKKRLNSDRVRIPTSTATRMAPVKPTTKNASVSFTVSERIVPPLNSSGRLGRFIRNKAVTHAINSLDIGWIFRIRFDLCAQIANMHIDRPFIALIGIARDTVEQVEPREDLSRRGDQRHQDGKFRRGQIDG